MLNLKGHYRIILAEQDSFKDANEAFESYDAGNNEKIIQYTEQDNVVTDQAWLGMYGDDWSTVKYQGYTTIGNFVLDSYYGTYNISLCSGSRNVSYDYRKASTYGSYGITQITHQGDTRTYDMNNGKMTISATFAAPGSNITINAIGLNQASSNTSYVYSVIWLTQAITQTTTTNLYCQYILNFGFIADSTSYNSYNGDILAQRLNMHFKLGTNSRYLYDGHKLYQGITSKLPPVDPSNVFEDSSYTTYELGTLATTNNGGSATMDFTRWRINPGTRTFNSSTDASLMWGKGVKTIFDPTGNNSSEYLTYNNYKSRTHAIGYTPLNTNFNMTTTQPHGINDNNVLTAPLSTPVPSSTSSVVIDNSNKSTPGYNREDFEHLRMTITRAGDSNLITICPVSTFDYTTGQITVTIPNGASFDNSALGNRPQVAFANVGGALPTGISAGVTYYATVISANVIQISATDSANFVTFSDNGSGTTTIERLSTAKAVITKSQYGADRFRQLMPFKPMIDGALPKGNASGGSISAETTAGPYCPNLEWMYSFVDFARKDDYVYILYNNSLTATPSMYLLRWRFKTIERPECVFKFTDNLSMSFVLVGNELWIAGGSGVAIMNISTHSNYSISSTLTTSNGLTANQCVFIDNVGSQIYVYHTNSLTVLNSDKSVDASSTTTINPKLNTSNAFDFLCAVPQVVNNCIIWGDVKSYGRYNYDTTASYSSTPSYIKIYNPVRATTDNLAVAIQDTTNASYYYKPASIITYAYTSNIIRIITYNCISNMNNTQGGVRGYVMLYEYNMTTGAFTNPLKQLTNHPTGINLRSNDQTYGTLTNMQEHYVFGNALTPASNPTNAMVAIFYVACSTAGAGMPYASTYSISINLTSLAVTSAATTNYVYNASAWGEYNYSDPININSTIHYRHSVGTNINHRIFSSDNNDYIFYGLGITTLNRTWDTNTQLWEQEYNQVYVTPTIALSDGFSITVSNAAGISSQSQLVANEAFSIFCGNGIIKKNVQSATLTNIPVYVGSMNKTTISYTVTGSTYTIPETSNVNFRILVDDETTIYNGSTLLTRVGTAPTGTQYSVSLAGVISFGNGLTGLTLDITYYTINRNT